eukprot:635216-Alexandrium_andersonii.AAC.1
MTQPRSGRVMCAGQWRWPTQSSGEIRAFRIRDPARHRLNPVQAYDGSLDRDRTRVMVRARA